jgi:glycosyltransferase involved in cell wall biosynthesis
MSVSPGGPSRGAGFPISGRLYGVSPHANFSGAPISALDHARLIGRHFDSTCLVLPEEGGIQDRARAAGIPVWLFPLERRGLRTGGWRRSFLRDLVAVVRSRVRFVLALMREFCAHPGLVHVHSSASIAPLALVAARWRQMPAVLHLREAPRSCKDRWRVRWLGALAGGVVCVSDGIRQGYGAWIRRHARVIHNYVEMPPPFASRQGGPPRISMVGRMSSAKGTDVFLQICARLQARGAEFGAWMVGEWAREADADAARQFLQAHGLAERVAIRPVEADMDAVYAGTDVLVLPTRRDSLPRVVMEAMAHGVPVVATRVDGLPEMVEDGVTGFLAEPGDVDGFTDAVERLLGDPELRVRQGQAGRARAEQLFAPGVYEAAMLDLYRGLLPGGGGA